MKYFAVLLLVMLAIVGCDDDNPAVSNNEPLIHSIEPQQGYEGDEITITGVNFGETRGESFVSFNGVKSENHSNWIETKIVVIVPQGVDNGKVWVEVGGVKSNEVDFTVLRKIEDYDEVNICNLVWMAKNLNTEYYRNGAPIRHAQSKYEWEDAMKKQEGAWCYYLNDSANGKIYGKLYNWYAVNDPRGLAPKGWHIATDDEWKELEMCLGMSQDEADKGNFRGTDEGSKLAGRSDLWQYGDLIRNENFDNSGFLSVPGGYRYFESEFFGMGFYSYWWTATADPNPSGPAWYRMLEFNNTQIQRANFTKVAGYSVRCVKDE
jgi:uncharacterized protein (TIGR02145 family)